MEYQTNQVVNVRQELSLKYFPKMNVMGNTKQLPVNVINSDHCIVSMYYPINVYDKLNEEIGELAKEVKRLKSYRYDMNKRDI